MKGDKFLDKRLVTFAIAAIMCLSAVALLPTTSAETILFFEDFEGSWGPYGDNPLPGWIIQDFGDESPATWNNNDWHNYADYTHGGTARVYYSPIENQDEVLITPSIACFGVTSVHLNFYTYLSHWGGTYTIEGSIDGGSSFPYLIHSYTAGVSGAYEDFDITSWALNQNIKIKFQYIDSDGYYWLIDDVKVSEPDPAGPGDSCDMAITASAGTNSNPGAPCWFEYTAAADGILHIDACGLAGVDTYLELWGECSDSVRLAYDDDGCPSKTLESSLDYPCSAGEDYYIFWDDKYSSSVGVPHDFVISEAALSPGDNCDDPIVVSIPSALPYTTSDTTCGRIDDYEDTCLGYYDGGDDIIFELQVASNSKLCIELDPGTYTYSGISIDDECPDTDLTCIDYSTSYAAVPHGFEVELDAGTYYIMIDSWPSPQCIDFDLSIVDCSIHDVGVSKIVSPFAAPLKGTDMVYGVGLNGWQSGLDDGPLTFDILDPGTITSLSTYPLSFFGGCWVGDTWYALEYNDYDYCNLCTIETDGTVTVVGNSGIDGYWEITEGLAYDPITDTMYASTIEIDSYGYVVDNWLYTVDMGTGLATLVGSMGYYGQMLAIEFDNDGNLYGVNLYDSHLYQIDTSDASVTDIGPLGITAAYAQDIAFDRTNEIMYWAMYGSVPPPKGASPASLCKAAPRGPESKGYGYLCTIDVSTGTATAGDELYGSAEIGALAIPPFTPEECWPQGTYPVEVMVKNYGDYVESFFDVYVEITEVSTASVVYSDSQTVGSMNPGDEILLDTFMDWDTIAPPGCNPLGDDYIVEACTLLSDDNPANDCEDEDGCLQKENEPPIISNPRPYNGESGVIFNPTLMVDIFDPDGDDATVEIFFDGVSMGTTVITGGDGTALAFPGEIEKGCYDWYVTADDGLASATSPTWTFCTAGVEAPTIQITSPNNGATLAGTVDVTWWAADSDDPNLGIYIYYKEDAATLWNRITALPLENDGEFSWNTASLADGTYALKVEAFNKYHVLAFDTASNLKVGNGLSGSMVSSIIITDTSIGSSQYVKNGDNLEIMAGITGGHSLSREDITADLSGFGMGTYVIADSYDGYTATWIITNAACSPSDGSVSITITAEDNHGSATITADNTNPEISIANPETGFYFLGKRFIPLSRTIIIGKITIELDTADESGISRVSYYIDDDLAATISDGSFDWYTNLPRGSHTLKAVAYDQAGNTNVGEMTFLKLL